MKQNKEKKKWSYRDFINDPFIYITLVISILTAVFVNESILHSVMVDLGIAMVGVSSALLGIVIAGLAIFLAFMDKKYIALIDQYLGIGNEIFPIKVTTILAIICLLFSIALILVGYPSSLVIRLILFGALWSYLYLLSQIYELIKWLVTHAKIRAIKI